MIVKPQTGTKGQGDKKGNDDFPAVIHRTSDERGKGGVTLP